MIIVWLQMQRQTDWETVKKRISYKMCHKSIMGEYFYALNLLLFGE